MHTTMQGAGGVGGLLAVSRNGAWHFPFYDDNGNITTYVKEQGAIVAEYAYDAFGEIIAQSGTMDDAFPHRFSTKYYDSETGLYYYGYRFYSPDFHRWVNRDPIAEEGGVNLYAFCGNNGVKRVDVLGLSDLTIILGPHINLRVASSRGIVGAMRERFPTRADCLLCMGAPRRSPVFSTCQAFAS